MRVALFATCVNDMLYPDTAIATTRLLERLGVEVDFPEAQTCCGQPQYNTGYRGEASRLAERMRIVFADYDYVVTPSGSCVAMVRDNFPRMGITDLGPRMLELTEFIVDVLGVEDVGASYPHSVTYHPSCHGLRMLGLGDRPLTLLRNVRGLNLVELPRAEECCGFGGTFAVKNPDVSAAMGADKIAAAASTGASVLCGADNSCLMHLAGMLRRADAPLRTVHLAEILAATESEQEVPA